MYTHKTLQEGIERLGITDPNEIASIVVSNYRNLMHLEKVKEREEREALWKNRFNIPYGLKKKEYEEMLKDIQKDIDETKDNIRHGKTVIWGKDELNGYIDKKKKVKNYIKFSTKLKGKEPLNIPKAKAFPIEQILEFNRAGKIKCLWHEENSPSLSWDKKRNKAHCFAGCGDFDSIDIFMKKNNTDFISAVKHLSK